MKFHELITQLGAVSLSSHFLPKFEVSIMEREAALRTVQRVKLTPDYKQGRLEPPSRAQVVEINDRSGRQDNYIDGNFICKHFCVISPGVLVMT